MKKLIVLLILLPVFVSRSYADFDLDAAADTYGVWEIENALDEESREITGMLGFTEKYDVKSALERLWGRGVKLAGEYLRSELGYGLELTAIALLFSVVVSLSPNSGISAYMNVICCSAAAVLIAGPVDSIINQAGDVLSKLSSYSKASLPAIFMSLAASGAVSSASVKYAAASMAVDLIMNLAQKYIIPLIYAYLGLSITRSIFDNPLLSAAARMCKWCATTMMTFTTIAFSAYISITGLIAGSTDALAVKTARTVISNALPVVGGILSDASGVVLSAASIIKNTAGVFALVSVCALCIGPFVELSVKMLVFRAAAAASDMLPGGKLSSLINDVGTTFSMLLGLVGCCGIMLFISIMSAMKAVTV